MSEGNPYQLRKGAHRFQMIYIWFIRSVLFFLPDSNFFMKFRGAMYRVVIKKCGPGFKVAHNVQINAPQKLDIGKNVYFANGCIVTGGGELVIGDNVLFGPHNLIIANNHVFNGEHYGELIDLGKAVIEDNCWVGGNCCIIKGAHLKKGSILAAGSVLNKAMENDHMLVAGNPAKEIKSILGK